MRKRKIKLNDARTVPPIDAREEWEPERASRLEVSRGNEVRKREGPGRPLALYRVIERGHPGSGIAVAAWPRDSPSASSGALHKPAGP